MKQYSGWQALFLSFWSSPFYRDVAKEWSGVGYLYLFLLICLTAFFAALQTQIVVVPITQRIIDGVATQLPSVTVEKGVLSIDKPSPYVIIEPKTSKPVITFDTRANPQTFEESKSIFLVTSNAIYTRRKMADSGTPVDGSDVEKVDFSTVDHFAFNMASAKQTIDSFLQWLGVLMFSVWVPLGFLFCVLQTLVYALIGMIFCNLSSVSLRYPTLIRLSAIALTPVLLLDSLQKVAMFNFPFWPVISILLALGYLYFAVWSNKAEAAAPPSEANPVS